jgi:hypothetical protein
MYAAAGGAPAVERSAAPRGHSAAASTGRNRARPRSDSAATSGRRPAATAATTPPAFPIAPLIGHRPSAPPPSRARR